MRLLLILAYLSLLLWFEPLPWLFVTTTTGLILWAFASALDAFLGKYL